MTVTAVLASSSVERGRGMCLAIPGKILEASGSAGHRTARVDFGGLVRQVCLNFVPEAQVGDFVLVHVGFAISRVDPGEAERSWQALHRAGLLPQAAEG
jgi:hydrogenase expression/formation protein HypC